MNQNVPTYTPTEVSPYCSNVVATIEKDGYFARHFSLPEHFGTHIDAPAHFIRGSWTLEEIPVERLVGRLVVLDVSDKAKHNSDYQVSVEDIVRWEHTNGEIPPNAVVMVYTAWESRWNSPESYRNADADGVLHFPGYSAAAAELLVERYNSVGLGIDTHSVDYGPSTDLPVHHYALRHRLYLLENVANLASVPVSGATVVVAPIKLEGGSGGPVRILALSA